MLRVVWSSIVRHTSFGFGAGFQTWALPIFAVDGDFADAGTLHPQAAEDDGSGLQQLVGDVWQWTSSAYTAYPGFRPLPGRPDKRRVGTAGVNTCSSQRAT